MNRRDDPRTAYIAIATQRFASHGYHGTSLAALARDSGVTKQALLHFFGTKERLYAAVLSDLEARLRADIEATYRPDPSEHLLAYFQAFRKTALSAPNDVRLVVRALLDSQETARKWPLKPYLDRLIALAGQTPGGRGAPVDAVLAWLSQMIGTIQYLAISAPAMTGMFGSDVARSIAQRFDKTLADAVQDFTQAART